MSEKTKSTDAHGCTRMKEEALNIAAIRQDFPLLTTPFHGKPVIYLDSAVSGQVPLPVIERMDHYQRLEHTNVHRGVSTLSQEATDRFEEAREKVRGFLNAASTKEIIWTRPAGITSWSSVVWFHFTDRLNDEAGRDNPESRFGRLQRYCFSDVPDIFADSLKTRRNAEPAKPNSFCAEVTGDYYGGVCNRPVKDKELMMCGIHASHEHKRLRENEEIRQRRQFHNDVEAALGSFVEELNEMWDLDAKLERKDLGGPTGNIVVNPGRLRDILSEKLEKF